MAEPQAPQGLALEAEADDYDETDSALGDDTASSTTSLSSTIYKHRHENGRTYHAFKGDEGKYAFPNDDTENDRLDLQHHLFSLTYDSKLFLAPVPETKKLGRVLDVGTGTGIWAIDFADAHPESEVMGVDLSPIQPGFIPPNLVFQIDDVEDPWTYTHKFDFIFSRMMTASIKSWPKLFEQIYE
jgi:SAM-dependent methyltransferase